MNSKENILNSQYEGKVYSAVKDKEVFSAMEQYAKVIAIGFKEWQDSNLEEKSWQQYDSPDRWINPHTREVITTEELYNLYLSQLK